MRAEQVLKGQGRDYAGAAGQGGQADSKADARNGCCCCFIGLAGGPPFMISWREKRKREDKVCELEWSTPPRRPWPATPRVIKRERRKRNQQNQSIKRVCARVSENRMMRNRKILEWEGYVG